MKITQKKILSQKDIKSFDLIMTLTSDDKHKMKMLF